MSHHTHQPGTAEGIAGPHSSRVANAVDPRVDSDLDGSRNAGQAAYGGGAPGTTAATTTGTTSTAGSATSGNDAAHSAAKGVKGLFAAAHGAGETLRGTVNSAVDETFGSSTGKAKNDAVTAQGIDEIETGKFGVGTKNREGALPGSDHERRY